MRGRFRKVGLRVNFKNYFVFLNYLGEKAILHVASGLFGREGRTACGEWTGHLSRTCIIFSIRCVYFVSFLSMHSSLGIYVSPWHMSCRWGSL